MPAFQQSQPTDVVPTATHIRVVQAIRGVHGSRRVEEFAILRIGYFIFAYVVEVAHAAVPIDAVGVVHITRIDDGSV